MLRASLARQVLPQRSLGLQRVGRAFYSNQVAKKSQSELDRPGKPTTSPVPRVSYEYPPPPNRPKVPRQSSAWRRLIPIATGVAGLAWAFYAYNYIFNSAETDDVFMNPRKFAKFRVTYKEYVTDDLMLMEISPKYSAHTQVTQTHGGLFQGRRLWSIQIRHPDIQIARNYTPLPMYYMQSRNDDGSIQALLRLNGSKVEDGSMVIMVKRYKDGEMSRYLHDLPVGSDIEIRGPFTEHNFPPSQVEMMLTRQAMVDVTSRLEPDAEPSPGITKPDNIAFFTAGTGIAPALQSLLSTSPPRGFTQVYHSVRTRDEIPFKRFIYFLEKAGRAKFHFFVDDENKFISLNDIPAPVPRQPNSVNNEYTRKALADPPQPPRHKYSTAIQQYMDPSRPWPYVSGEALAVVCGPPGYVTYMTGDPGIRGENPISNLLGAKGWTLENTFRMLDL